MPELPEVEAVVRGLRPDLVGQRIAGVSLPWPRWVKDGDSARLIAGLRGRAITAIERRGKYIVFRFDDGSQLLSHLRMTGRWLVDEPEFNRGPQASCVLEFQSGRTAVFYDTRRFGRASYYAPDEEPPEYAAIGIDPLDPALTAAALCDLLRGRRRELKALLLDQRILGGLGNIYVSEILFEAQINPFKRADQLTKPEVERFHTAMRRILKAAIAKRGTTVFDFRGARNREGSFQKYLQVYQRQGLPCTICGSTIYRAVQGQRSTFFCPTCQRVSARTTRQVTAGTSQTRRERVTDHTSAPILNQGAPPS